MTEQQFRAIYPFVGNWINHTLQSHARNAHSVASLGFARLPQYYSNGFLEAARVVYVSPVPVPPLTAFGLKQFESFEHMNAVGITYMETFFSLPAMRDDECHHFHELVHVAQWRVLGPERFLLAYAQGLETAGYRHSPLEVMAYTLESVFNTNAAPFDVLSVVRAELAALYP